MKLKIEENKRILVVAPHPDDESIGCGGLLQIYGRQIDVMLLTDGRRGKCSHCLTEEDLVNTRKIEFMSAMRYVAVNNIYLFNIPEGNLRRSYKLIKKFDFSPYDYVFVPNKYETHHDHADSYCIIKKCIHPKKQKMFQYEVWTPLRYPTHYLDITDVINEKEKMIDIYKSQTESVDYIGRTKGLNRYRAIRNTESDYDSGFAEAYAVDHSILYSVGSGIYHELPYEFKRLFEKLSSIIFSYK